jgi:hypothetical protein
MDTPRPAFQVNTNRPGSDVAAETAAALAAASLAFRDLDSIYSARLLTSAIQVCMFTTNAIITLSLLFSCSPVESWNYVVICWSRESLVDFSICFYFGAVVSDNKFILLHFTGTQYPLRTRCATPRT